jgi:hypothetical protein
MAVTRQRTGPVVDVEQRVRQNTGSAGLAAGLLIFFGFFYIVKPTDDGLWAYAALAFYHTLRFGGLAMAAIAVFSSLGQPLALLLDAVVSCLIGALLILTGVLMAIGGGDLLQPFISIVCGAMFVSAGLRNGRDFSHFPAETEVQEEFDPAAEEVASVLKHQPKEDQPADAPPSLAGVLLDRADREDKVGPKRRATGGGATTGGARFASHDEVIHLPDSDDPASLEDVKPPPPPEQEAEKKRRPESSPPPDGFLADLGNEEPPPHP